MSFGRTKIDECQTVGKAPSNPGVESVQQLCRDERREIKCPGCRKGISMVGLHVDRKCVHH